MKLKPATKVPLSKVTHSVRASQAILQYGVGAMIDFPDQTLMTAAPEYWATNTIKIEDERLAKLLHVDYFGMPGSNDEAKFYEGMSYVRFPQWYFCPKCRKFQSLKDWISEYKRKGNPKALEYDPYMAKHLRCTSCKQDLVVTRIITVCANGHIDDFPWVKWVHYKNINGGPKEPCSHPDIRFKTGASATEGLEGLVITCEKCNAKATLKDAFDPGIFDEMNKKIGRNLFKCSGFHPWKNIYEDCTKYPKTMQRGSSSVYFPVVSSSLVIPPYSDELNKKIENSIAFDSFRTTLSNIPMDYRQTLIQSKLQDWSEELAIEIGINSVDTVRTILERKWSNQAEVEYSTLSVKYRAEEYDALNGNISLSNIDSNDFIREDTDINEYNIPFIKNITLIHKIREVQALTGFSRIQPIEKMSLSQDSKNYVSIKKPQTNWYPAYEVRGEGIFIEFDQNEIDKWLNSDEGINRRVEELNDKYKNSFIGETNPRCITSKFLLLHTISHLLIKQLSFECGYSIASLKERIYSSEDSEGKKMAGILIYTASGDSEGTMGGLVRQGRPDCFGKIFKKSIISAMSCSNDPVCILSKGQGRDSLNLAACHACALLPETSCEEYNIFLDRAVVVGTFSNKQLGFYSDILYRENAWENYKANSNDNETKNCNSLTNNTTLHIIMLDRGIDFSDMSYSEVWNELKTWSEDDNEKIKLDQLINKSQILYYTEKPICNGSLRIIESNEEIKADLIWKNLKILLFLTDNAEDYEKAKDSDWKCLLLSDEETTSDSIINELTR